MVFNTASVSLAVTPTVVSTLFSHYLKRKPLRQRPTAHLSYDEGLHLIRSFMLYASHHTVDQIQAFTAQWVPHPQWIRVEDITVPDEQLLRAAALLEEQLGPEGIRRVGGSKWWQWRKPQSPLKAEWIEMRADYNERKRTEAPLTRVMLYVHGGAYYFGSVDEHRYQMQRHARKLKARVLAPNYRLAPQFPFPCGLQDCLATYLDLIATQDPRTILLAGDSAGGGMVLALLVLLRDRNLPLPAGAILISPWCDLTHSFPSVAADCPFDYIPQYGFHHKPSMSWPPSTEEELQEIAQKAGTVEASATTQANLYVNRLSCLVEDEEVHVHEQIQMYTTNELMAHPLVSPIMQPTLGGLPPLLITVGGGEILRDEQIYLAHKCADPAKYAPPADQLDAAARAAIARYKPTEVQLQVWEDLCHVAPTLSFTRPAKYMFRSIAQFGAWALARAQETEIEILDDDRISVISSSTSTSSSSSSSSEHPEETGTSQTSTVGKAGDPLPPFEGHMIRQAVTRHGVVLPLPPPHELPGCTMPAELVGVPKEGPVTKWLQAKQQWDSRYASERAKVHKRRLRDAAVGFESFGPDEHPPPSALAARRRVGVENLADKEKKRSYGLSLWSLWGSKHDESTVVREMVVDDVPAAQSGIAVGRERRQQVKANMAMARSHSKRRIVRDEQQVELEMEQDRQDGNTLVADYLAWNGESGTCPAESPAGPGAAPTGATGKRAFVGGIAMPFALHKDAETASMKTLESVEAHQA